MEKPDSCFGEKVGYFGNTQRLLTTDDAVLSSPKQLCVSNSQQFLKKEEGLVWGWGWGWGVGGGGVKKEAKNESFLRASFPDLIQDSNNSDIV